jgi:hypothetical protein
MVRLLLLLAFIPFRLNAATDSLPVVDTSVLKDLYGIITRKISANDIEARWAHRSILYKALGIDPVHANDSAAYIRMRFGWRQLQTVRISKENEPSVFFKDILRLSLHHAYGPLLLDAVRWKVDVNSFDPATYSSLMDYLEEEYRNNYEDKRLEWLREYKQVLQYGGAVYFAETNFRMQQLARKYDRIRPPVDGLYPVQRKGKWGWVDQNNKPVIPLQYKAVRYFTGELFEVSDDGTHFRIISL